MTRLRSSLLKLSMLEITGLLLITTLSARAEEPPISISGYDPVAYFTDGKPVEGNADFEYLWHGQRWRFASAEHRDLFAKDPERYAPQYDGFCALGAASGAKAHKDTADPLAWGIVGGKLYLVHDQHWLKVWQEKSPENIRQADQDWDAVKTLPGPEIIGPPCAGNPPTTKISLREGGHLLAVGAQVARDQSGQIVGKGDVRAQIEQVGKNVNACLASGGATIDDVLFSVSYVTELTEFNKYRELRSRYFGAPSPKDSVVTVPQLADPDLLVQVEAIAKVK